MDIEIAIAAQWAALLVLILALVLARQVTVRWGWLFGAILITAAMLAAYRLGRHIPIEAVFGDLDWNWGGKIASILMTVAVLAVLWWAARKSPSASGISFSVRDGALTPALIVTGVLILASIGLEVLASDGADTGAERLLYQASMPGLEEEILWRGTLLLAMEEALRGGRFRLGGAELSWAGMLVTLLFATAHGVQFADGAFAVSWAAVLVTGVLGFGLYWLRARTGSVVIPIIAHNLINVSDSFF